MAGETELASSSIVIKHRESTGHDSDALPDLHPVLRQVYLNRGVTHEQQLDRTLKNLPNYQRLSGIDKAVSLIKTAIKTDQKDRKSVV